MPPKKRKQIESESTSETTSKMTEQSNKNEEQLGISNPSKEIPSKDEKKVVEEPLSKKLKTESPNSKPESNESVKNSSTKPNLKEEEEEESKQIETTSKRKELSADDFFTGDGSVSATKRLLKELGKILDLEEKGEISGWSAAPIQDNLYKWEVKFFDFDPASALGKDLVKYKSKFGFDHVLLEMKFSHDYPWSPPFIRVVKPRFQFRTGHVTVGGSICMELLTKSGWAPVTSIESILIQIRTEMLEGGAKLDFINTHPYTEQEAKDAFMRVAREHKWEK